MFKRFLVLWLAVGAAAHAAPSPPYEIVRDHVEIEIAQDGTYTTDREEVYRILDTDGIKLLQTRRLYFTQGYETLEIREAYDLKPNGRRIDVPPADIVQGVGHGVGREYFDRQSIRISFAALEPQDQVVLVTRFRQTKPWFAGHFDIRALFSRTIAADDVTYKLSVPANMALHIDANGLSGGAGETTANRRHWVWHFTNDTPDFQTADAVSEADFSPHLHISTFSGYAEIAQAYRDMAKDKAEPTKDIAELAETVTRGIDDKREQARLLYEWVCNNISYVAIELGIGGFAPHNAEDVLQNRFGDCKDRAVLLEALLAAKGIESTPVLINAGAGSYKLPLIASPHVFDHVITYIPAFNLFVDASDAFAPFGVLPFADTGKPALLAASGKVVHTPVTTAAQSTVRVSTQIIVGGDGAGEGTSWLSATGAYGVGLRTWMQSLAKAKDEALLHGILGPSSEGKIDRGAPEVLSDPFTVSAQFRQSGTVVLPGPGAIPQTLAFRPFSFDALVGGQLPAERNSDYVCPSFTAEETFRLTLPAKAVFISIPTSKTIEDEQIRLEIRDEPDTDHSWTEKIVLTVDHPEAVCTADYYHSVRSTLKKMQGLLHRQAIYRERTNGTP